jgi:hypothetical protein
MDLFLERCQTFSLPTSTSEQIRLIKDRLPMPALWMAFFGTKLKAQDYCPFHGGETGTVFCVYWSERKRCYYYYCHNAECRRQGDVIDLYIGLMKTERYRYIDGVSAAALQLLIMVEEGVFNPQLTDLEGGTITPATCCGCSSRKNEGESDLVTAMERELRTIPRDERLYQEAIQSPVPNDGVTGETALGFSVAAIATVIHCSYPGNTWLPVAKGKKEGYRSRRKEYWLANKHLCEMSFIWKCCFKKPRAIRANCLESTWMVIEFDAESVEEKEKQPVLFHYLRKEFPGLDLHLIVDTTKRSFHGWWWIEKKKQEEWFELFKMARRLGADPTTIRPELRVRLPNGWNRETDKMQRVVWISEEFDNLCNCCKTLNNEGRTK